MKQTATQQRDAKLLEIASYQLYLCNLEITNSSADFEEHGIRQIKLALEDAYEAGRKAGAGE